MRTLKTTPLASVGQAYHSVGESLVITKVDKGQIVYAGVNHNTRSTFNGRSDLEDFFFQVAPYLAEDLLTMPEDIHAFLCEQANVKIITEGFVITEDMYDFEEVVEDDFPQEDNHLHTFVDEDEDEDMFFPQVDRGVYATMHEDDLF